MKPRQQPCPLTEEDSRIWTRRARFSYNGSFFLSRHQDRRDADLMLAAQKNPRWLWIPHPSIDRITEDIPWIRGIPLGFLAALRCGFK